MKARLKRLWPLLTALLLLTLLLIPHFSIHAFYGYIIQLLIAFLMTEAVSHRCGRNVYLAMCVLIPVYCWYVGFIDKVQIPFHMAATGALMGILQTARERRCWLTPVAASLAFSLICAFGIFVVLLLGKEMSLGTSISKAVIRQLRPWACVTLGVGSGWLWQERRVMLRLEQ